MHSRSDLDPVLPGLPFALDLEAVSERFQDVWGREEKQPVAISGCKRVDTKYEPEVRCVAAYELSGRRADGRCRGTIGVVEIDASGASHRLFRDDPELSGLAHACDRERMRERLSTLPGATAQRPVEVRRITPVRYKPRRSCVLRYTLSSRAGQRTLVGKLVAGEGGEQRMRALLSLHEASRATPQMPRILEPLAYWPDLRLLVQPAVTGGRELARSAFDLSLPPAMRCRWIGDAGTGVAALHSTVTVAAPRRTIEDDLRELRAYEHLFARLAPDLARSFEGAVASIARLAGHRPEPAPVASHGALRADQFLIDDSGRLVLIDFDGFCWANPARDVGNLLAYLDWKAIHSPDRAAPAEEARDAFLDGYGAVAPTGEGAWLELYRTASMLKIAGRRLRSLSFEEWGFLPELLDVALARLGAC